MLKLTRLRVGISVFSLALRILFNGINTLVSPLQLSKLIHLNHQATTVGLGLLLSLLSFAFFTAFQSIPGVIADYLALQNIAPAHSAMRQQIGTDNECIADLPSGWTARIDPPEPTTLPIYLLQGLALLVGVVGVAEDRLKNSEETAMARVDKAESSSVLDDEETQFPFIPSFVIYILFVKDVEKVADTDTCVQKIISKEKIK